MEPVKMEQCVKPQDDTSAPLPFARSYQLEALEKALKQNTLVFLETGSGKTLIAIMLLRSYAHLLRRPEQSCIAVFLVPTVVLVMQQATVIETHTDLKVGKYWGDMGVDFWDAAIWKNELQNHEVLVMTPKILLDALSRSYVKLDIIKVLIFDECHNAKGKHPYACIMKEFYHRQLHSHEVPRIFGMTASPVKAKVKGLDYWKEIGDLENLMHSKIYTCASEAVLAEYIPFPKAKVKLYDEDTPDKGQLHVISQLAQLMNKHIDALRHLSVDDSTEKSLYSKLKRLSSTYKFCLVELGLWPTLKAAEILSSEQADIFSWGSLDIRGETTIKAFNSDVLKELSTAMPSGFSRSISDVKANMGTRLITSKVMCLVESIIEYRGLKDLRCIIFVERAISAMVLQAILGDLLFEASGWRTRYIAGNHSTFKSQSRNEHNKIVEDFRRGIVHILLATSILEEGLDVQSCNLVVRFDPSGNVCSFIQSRGRARMLNSDFLLMVRRGCPTELARVQDYLSCGEVMRKESLDHSSLPCKQVVYNDLDEHFYRVPSTGATVTLSSSVSLVYFYCSRLPSDSYFKPYPRCTIDELSGTCTIQFPNSSPLRSVTVGGNKKALKQLACLEACRRLHKMGALTDNLVPDIVVEENAVQEIEGEPYNANQAYYIPSELVSDGGGSSSDVFYCYFLELKEDFFSDIPLRDVILVLKTKLDPDIGNMNFDMAVDWGNISVHMKYTGSLSLNNEQVFICKMFQVAILKLMRDHDYGKLVESMVALRNCENKDVCPAPFEYLLLPCVWPNKGTPVIDWTCISSISNLKNGIQTYNSNSNHSQSLHYDDVYTMNGYVNSSMLGNCLVCTPHNGYIYCISGILDGMNANSLLILKDGEHITYKSYYKKRHGIDLLFGQQSLLCGRQVFRLQNFLLRSRSKRERESSSASVELPPELCVIIMSPISVSTVYTFSFVPSVMHRVESLLLSANLRSIIMDHGMPNVHIPAAKILKGITAKQCQESFHLESLEALGDSFLKYAVGQHLFKEHQSSHEGLLSIKKDKIVSNSALCKLGCQRRIPGFIRDEPFDPKKWTIPGDLHGNCILKEESLSTTTKIYVRGSRQIKRKRVADVVEALIGVFLTMGGEVAAISFMKWLGIEVDLLHMTIQRNWCFDAHKHINVGYLEKLLKYSFKDKSLLVEALTHGSYMLPDIPRCYQRLEFLGDSVLDHILTLHIFSKYPGMSPGLLTDLRSASVNNDCYSLSAVRAGLHKHVLHASQQLHKQMAATVVHFQQQSDSTFGWESDFSFPKVLADIIESLAGAIFVDSGCNKEVVFKSIMPLLEPLITPETLRYHPVRELQEVCQKHNFCINKPVRTSEDGIMSLTLEVEANGVVYTHTCTGSDKKTAKKVAAKAILSSLKESIPELEVLTAAKRGKFS